MERFSIKIAPKHIIFDYSWDKKETNKLFRLVCLFWWEMVDSNHRSRWQQIYSLPPLAAREISLNRTYLLYHILRLLSIFFWNKFAENRMLRGTNGERRDLASPCGMRWQSSFGKARFEKEPDVWLCAKALFVSYNYDPEDLEIRTLTALRSIWYTVTVE